MSKKDRIIEEHVNEAILSRMVVSRPFRQYLEKIDEVAKELLAPTLTESQKLENLIRLKK